MAPWRGVVAVKNARLVTINILLLLLANPVVGNAFVDWDKSVVIMHRKEQQGPTTFIKTCCGGERWCDTVDGMDD
jgi:hypothetical protein